MRRLATTEEAARILGVTLRTVQKKFAKGKIEGEFVNSGKGYGKGGQVLKVWIETSDGEIGRSASGSGSAPEGLLPRREEPLARREGPLPRREKPLARKGDGEKKAKSKNRTRIIRGEPGCHVVTPIMNGEPMINDRQETIEEGRETNLPTIINIERSIPASCQKIANLRFALIQTLQDDLSKEFPKTLPLFNNNNGGPPRPSKTKSIQKFLDLYNTGLLLPDIYDEFKQISRTTLYNWLQLFNQGGIDALIPQYGGVGISKILPGEKDFLLKFLLNQNKPKISDGIRECKRYLGDYSTSGPSTLRRFINQFKTNYYDTWTLKRGGEKAWNDEVASYQDRDPMLLNVGDVIVADGHKLNLHVKDPLTGKKKRAVLVLFWDWKSTFPLGWEIMFSENTQCIASALRNALLTLGKIPSNIYIDNGKAFLAKIFTRKLRIEETEIPGMIARLGSRYRRAMPYHGQSKPIERFFLIINDRLERRLPSYTGASIKDKPPYLLRNEKLANQLHDDWAPTVEQLNEIMFQWREEYIDEPRPRRQGLTARQIFDEGKGAGLDPKALCFLMMAAEVKSVRRSRFTFAGIDWEGPCIYGYRGRVLIRYSLFDYKQIYVFDPGDHYMGTVTQCGKADPIKDWQAAKRIVVQRRSDKRETKKILSFIQEKRFLIEGRRDPLRAGVPYGPEADLIEYFEAEEVKKPQIAKLSPFGDAPDQGQSPFYEVAEVPSVNRDSPRPRWKYDYEKYDWLLAQSTLTPDDRKWIDEYRANSSLYKHTVFGDAKELDRKVTDPDTTKASYGAGGINERPFCSDQVD